MSVHKRRKGYSLFTQESFQAVRLFLIQVHIVTFLHSFILLHNFHTMSSFIINSPATAPRRRQTKKESSRPLAKRSPRTHRTLNQTRPTTPTLHTGLLITMKLLPTARWPSKVRLLWT